MVPRAVLFYHILFVHCSRSVRRNATFKGVRVLENVGVHSQTERASGVPIRRLRRYERSRIKTFRSRKGGGILRLKKALAMEARSDEA